MRGCDGQREREKQAKKEIEPKLSKWLRVFSSIWILIRRAIWIVQFVMDPLCVSRTHALYPMDMPRLEKNFLIQKWNSDHTADSTLDVSLWGYIPFWRTLKWSLINTASHLTSRNAMETDIHKEEQQKNIHRRNHLEFHQHRHRVIVSLFFVCESPVRCHLADILKWAPAAGYHLIGKKCLVQLKLVSYRFRRHRFDEP